MAGFREHRQRLALQEQQAQIAQGEAVNITATPTQSSLDIVLKNELNKIKALPTHAQRNEYKRLQFLPKFLPLAREHLAKNRPYQNDTVGFCVMYLLDVGDFANALELADLAIQNGQKMPEGILRTIPHFVADSLFDYAEKATSQGQSAEPYFSQALAKIDGNHWIVSEITKAKWYKLTAKLLILARNHQGKVKTALVSEPKRLELAIKAATLARRYNHKVGVNSLIVRMFMRLKALIQFEVYTEAELEALQKQLEPPLENSNPEGLASGLNSQKLCEIQTLLQSPSLSLQEVAKARAKEKDEEKDEEKGNV